MIKKFYPFYDLPYSHDVCHLFEHLVLRTFLEKISKLGYSRAFFGWLNGQTIDSSIFFDLGTFSDEIVTLFEEHLEGLGDFESEVIDQSCAHIEAEMKSTITISDKVILRQQLSALSESISQTKNHRSHQSNSQPINIAYRPNRFRDIAMLVNLNNVSPKEQKAFLVFYPALLDMIRDAAVDTESAYPVGVSPLVAETGSIGIAQKFSIKKDVDVALIERLTQKNLQKIDVLSMKVNIEKYVQAFMHEEWENTALIRIFDQTDIKTSQEELMQLATSKRLEAIIQNMTVRVEPVKGGLKKIEWTN